MRITPDGTSEDGQDRELVREPVPEPVRELVLVLVDGLNHADLALVHREALRVLRPGIDVRDDEQFELLLDLVPYTIHAEARRGDRQILSANDSGTSLWLAVTREQEAELRSRLRESGLPSAAVLVDPSRRGGGVVSPVL